MFINKILSLFNNKNTYITIFYVIIASPLLLLGIFLISPYIFVGLLNLIHGNIDYGIKQTIFGMVWSVIIFLIAWIIEFKENNLKRISWDSVFEKFSLISVVLTSIFGILMGFCPIIALGIDKIAVWDFEKGFLQLIYGLLVLVLIIIVGLILDWIFEKIKW